MKRYIKSARDNFIGLTAEELKSMPQAYDWSDIAYRGKNLSYDVLDTIAKADSSQVQAVRWLAQRNDLPEDILRYLSRHGDQTVRYHVAKNPNTPSDIFDTFLNDKRATVRKALASRKDLSEIQYSILAEDSDVSVRRAIARNKAVPNTVLEILENDEDPDIITIVQHRLYNKPSSSKQAKDLAKRAQISTSPEELDELSKSKYPSVRLAVAKNEYASEDTLRRLYTDTYSKKFGDTYWDEGQIVIYLAQNINTPLDVLEDICDNWTPTKAHEYIYYRDDIPATLKTKAENAIKSKDGYIYYV